MTAMPERAALRHEARRDRAAATGAKLALRRTAGSVLITPRQFGPDEPHAGARGSAQQLALAAHARPRRSRAKPADTTTSACTPLRRAVARDVEHRGGGDGDDDEVELPGTSRTER